MKTRNGWKRLAFIATTIVAVGAAVTVLENYAPWAPRVTFALATENTLARLDNQMITLLALEAQAKAGQDRDATRRLQALIRIKEREIKDLEKLKDRHE
jgi:hypothetical protein